MRYVGCADEVIEVDLRLEVEEAALYRWFASCLGEVHELMRIQSFSSDLAVQAYNERIVCGLYCFCEVQFRMLRISR